MPSRDLAQVWFVLALGASVLNSVLAFFSPWAILHILVAAATLVRACCLLKHLQESV